MIEDITGVYSGSVYNENKMIDAGFIGEADAPTSGRTIVVKNHGQRKMEYADGIVLLGNLFNLFNHITMIGKITWFRQDNKT